MNIDVNSRVMCRLKDEYTASINCSQCKYLRYVDNSDRFACVYISDKNTIIEDVFSTSIGKKVRIYYSYAIGIKDSKPYHRAEGKIVNLNAYKVWIQNDNGCLEIIQQQDIVRMCEVRDDL